MRIDNLNVAAAQGTAPVTHGSGLRSVLARRIVWSLVAVAAFAWISGCGQRGRSGVGMPRVNPTAAAKQAIELYDKDGSGSLDESELATCPGILAARDRYDMDGNGEISQEEIAARLRALYASGTPWVSVNCQVFQSGRPLAGAVVRFVPEPFLEEALQPAVGTTDNQGRASPAVADEMLPEDKRGLHIMQPGVYRVEIEHPSVRQPHKPLGWEVDELSRGGTEPVFHL